jgi:xylulokinase
VSYFIGIDTSTTATKALLMDDQGSIVAIGRSTYDFAAPHPLWSEQDPQLWWEATVAAIREVLSTSGVSGADIGGIGLTGQMHGLVMLGADGRVLRPAILWNDQRTQDECDEIRSLIGAERLIATTGNDALTGFTAPKILWVRNNEPAVFERTEHILLPKDYLRYLLTGEFATDRAGASGTILFDLAERDWSRAIVKELGIPNDWLPKTHEGPEVTGALTAKAADATGVAAGTPVFAGGGDQSANAVGVGAVSPGIIAMSIGTSGVVFAPTATPAIEPMGRLHAFCHCVPDTWSLMGVMLSAAGSLQWFRDELAPDRSFPEISAMAASVPAASNGLFFLPYLSGERTPHPDPLARGAFVGLTVRHERRHMARSVMEGVAFGLKDSAELISAATDVGEVRVSGGGASSSVWLQIIADVMNLSLRVVGTEEAAAHGAALLAATGAGAFRSVAEASSYAVEVGAPIEPTRNAAIYEDAYGTYRDLYPALRAAFHRSARLDTP